MSARIVIATIMRPTGTTGVQTHFQAFARGLAASGGPCDVVTPYSAPLILVYPMFALRRLIDLVSKPASVWWYREIHKLFLKLALRGYLRRWPDCVVYAQCPLAAEAAISVRKSKAQRVCMVVHFNVSQADEWADKGMLSRSGGLYAAIQRFEAAVLPALDGLVCVSSFMRHALQDRIPGIRSTPTAVIPNFLVDPGEQSDASQATTDLIAIGTLEPRKNQRYLIDIVDAARQLGRRLSLTIVGDGPDREALRRDVEVRGLADQVVFKGFVRNAADLIADHRALIHVAHMESFGIVLIEAMARGRPVFAPARGGMTEVFADGVEGAQIALDDAPTAAKTVLAYLDDKALLLARGRAARACFLAKYEASANTARLYRFLTLAEGR